MFWGSAFADRDLTRGCFAFKPSCLYDKLFFFFFLRESLDIAGATRQLHSAQPLNTSFSLANEVPVLAGHNFCLFNHLGQSLEPEKGIMSKALLQRHRQSATVREDSTGSCLTQSQLLGFRSLT